VYRWVLDAHVKNRHALKNVNVETFIVCRASVPVSNLLGTFQADPTWILSQSKNPLSFILYLLSS
jgi:hypothetical protein